MTDREVMQRIAYLIFGVLSLVAFCLPLFGRAPHDLPTIVVPHYKFELEPGRRCSDPSLRRICNEVKVILPELEVSIAKTLEMQTDYEILFPDFDFAAEESSLTNDWKTKDHEEASKRPYIIEAKVTRLHEDQYYVVFHGRLIGEQAWHIPRTFPKGGACKLTELNKHRVEAEEALAAVCDELSKHWKRHNE